MGGNSYINFQSVFAVYIIMIMTSNVSVNQTNSMVGVQKFTSNPYLELDLLKKVPCSIGVCKDSEFHHRMIMKENYNLMNNLDVFLNSKVFPFTLDRKLINLNILKSAVVEELVVVFQKYLQPKNEQYFLSVVFLYCACFIFLILHKQIKTENTNSHGSTRIDFPNMYKATTSLLSMLNIKGEIEISAIFSSDDITNKYGWMFKHNHIISKKNWFVYPVSDDPYYSRLASYSRLAYGLNDVSFVKLAKEGFVLMDKDLYVECQECGKTKEIFNFNSLPSEEKYHYQGCSFGKAKDYNEEQKDNNTLSQDSISGATGNNYMPSHEKPSDASTPSCDSIPGGATSNTCVSFQEIQSNTGFPQILQVINSAGFPDDDFSIEDDIECDSAIDVEDQHFEHHNVGSVPPQKLSQTLPLQLPTCDTKLKGNYDNESLSESFKSNSENNFGLEPQRSLSAGGIGQKTIKNRTSHFTVPPKDSVGQKKRSNSDSNSSACSLDADVKFDDSELFQPEYESVSQDVRTTAENCKKNRGHYGYVSFLNFKMESIPSKVRHPDVLRFFERVSNLTVRIVVGNVMIDKEQKCRFGTGYAVSKPESNYYIPTTEHTAHPGTWRAVKKYLHINRHKDNIYIQTNRHLVNDETEAKSTTVEFFYNNSNRKEIVFAKGVSVSHSSILGDLKSILVCKTSDLTLVNMVNESSDEIDTLAKNFPQSIKEEMMKRVFMIGHPHGGEKMFAYGEYVMLKFALSQENVNDHTTTRIVKVSNNTEISESENMRKTLLYTADTCNGSIGSPVVSFTKIGSGTTENIILDMWMHNGLDRKNGLNASTMRVLTQEDISNHGHQSIIRPSIQEDITAEADRAANQVVSCPVYTVLQQPAYPAYVAYNKRLLSYPNPFNHIYTAIELADSGFFYAGYADCVRCFQCGLGLRSWKHGDIIHEEHGKNRPDCQFLRLKLRESGIPAIQFLPNSVQNTDSSHNLTSSPVAILEREQTYLKQILICKVCFQKPVKDLFLPCGELVACLDCSKLLTHCPSCNKKIVATLTTYFS